jgi:biotin carboxyl carrier protein
MEERVVKAPIVGKIVKVYFKAGDSVQKGDVLLTLEAMKMENEIYAPISGVIKEIAVSSDMEVDQDDPLVTITAC